MLLAVDLVGFSDLAKLLGVSKSRAEDLVKEEGFPPAHKVGTGRRKTRVWDLHEVIRWAQERQPPRRIYLDDEQGDSNT